MDNNEEFIFCTRCGSRMKKEQRCCIKCGNLNFLNEDNNSMKKYAKSKLFSKKVPVNRFINNNIKSTDLLYAEKAGSRKACLTFNLICYVIEVLCAIMITIFNINNGMSYFALALIIIFLTYFNYSLMGLQFCFMKANLPWWSVFVPFYNLYNWFLLTFKNGWLFLIIFIPIIGQIFLFISYFNFGRKFDRSGIISFLFFPFVVGNIGFDISSIYEGTAYIFIHRQIPNYFLKIYKTNNLILHIFEIIMFVCTLYFFYVLVVNSGLIS